MKLWKVRFLVNLCNISLFVKAIKSGSNLKKDRILVSIVKLVN